MIIFCVAPPMYQFFDQRYDSPSMQPGYRQAGRGARYANSRQWTWIQSNLL